MVLRPDGCNICIRIIQPLFYDRLRFGGVILSINLRLVERSQDSCYLIRVTGNPVIPTDQKPITFLVTLGGPFYYRTAELFLDLVDIYTGNQCVNSAVSEGISIL